MSAKISAQLSRAVSLSSNTRFVRNDFVQPTHMNDSFFSDIGRQCWPVKPLYDPNGNLFDDHVQQMKNGGRKTERNTWLYQQFNLTIEPIKGWRLIGDLSYRYNTQYAHEDLLTISQIGVDGVTKVRSWDENSSVSESSFASAYVFPASQYVVSAAGRFAAMYSTMHIASTTISAHQRMILLVFDMVISSQNHVM